MVHVIEDPKTAINLNWRLTHRLVRLSAGLAIALGHLAALQVIWFCLWLFQGTPQVLFGLLGQERLLAALSALGFSVVGVMTAWTWIVRKVIHPAVVQWIAAAMDG